MAIPFWDPLPSIAEGPTFAPDSWDVITIGGQRLPGVAVVKGAPTLAFDKKKAGGVDGATITVNGYLPGPIEIEVTIWTDAQWTVMQEVADLIWRKPNKKTKASDLALTLSNPRTDLWKNTSVVVLGVSVPEDGKVQGTKVIKIKCVEFVPQDPTSKTKTAKAAGNIVPIAPQYDPSRNQPGKPPWETDIQPGGPPKNKKGGVS